MNTEHYNNWIKSHQIENGIDISDAVMSGITKKSQEPTVVKQTYETVFLNLVQANGFVRACVLAFGAVIGVSRMIFQIYSALFV